MNSEQISPCRDQDIRMSYIAVFDFRIICVVLFCLGDCIAFGLSSISGTIILIYFHIYIFFILKNLKLQVLYNLFSCIDSYIFHK